LHAPVQVVLVPVEARIFPQVSGGTDACSYFSCEQRKALIFPFFCFRIQGERRGAEDPVSESEALN